MAENTKIQWADHTFNHVRGCTKIAPGCANCYADAQSQRNPRTLGIWGPNGTRVVASEAIWRQPLQWNRVAGSVGDHPTDIGRSAKRGRVSVQTGIRPRVFCASLADVFEDWGGVVVDAQGRPLHEAKAWGQRGEWIGVANTFIGKSIIRLDDVRARLFRLIDETPNLDWLLLTKRPENVRRMIPPVVMQQDSKQGPYRHAAMDGIRKIDQRRNNLWLGVSIACQEDADRNIRELLKCSDLCAKTFLSIEPLVGPVDLGLDVYESPGWYEYRKNLIDWVIVGGESGPNARPCDIEWVRAIVRQCRAAGVPCFVKQLGRKVYDNDGVARCGWPGLTQFQRHNGDADNECQVILRDPKGGDPAEWPEDLRVREVPS